MFLKVVKRQLKWSKGTFGCENAAVDFGNQMKFLTRTSEAKNKSVT